MDKNLTVGQKIKQFRNRAGISQLELEMRIETSPGSISRIESGQVNPTKETLRKIIEVLDLKSKEAILLFDLNFDELPKVVKLAKKMISSLDLDEVLQIIANEIVYDLDLFGCLVFLCDEEYVYAKTLTETWYTKAVFKMLPSPYHKLKASLIENKDNYVVKTIIERKPQFSTVFHNFSKGVFPNKITDLIQKFNGTKCVVSFPLIVENNVIGAVIFTKDDEYNFDLEFDILQTFVEHIAIAVNHAQKYEELKKQLDITLTKVL